MTSYAALRAKFKTTDELRSCFVTKTAVKLARRSGPRVCALIGFVVIWWTRLIGRYLSMYCSFRWWWWAFRNVGILSRKEFIHHQIGNHCYSINIFVKEGYRKEVLVSVWLWPRRSETNAFYTVFIICNLFFWILINLLCLE